ncbi:MAG: hypothetical protein HQK65_17550 [Desulfamplus sp.]|nr:hypothetical protein [Desulfamplus sp.]
MKENEPALNISSKHQFDTYISTHIGMEISQPIQPMNGKENGMPPMLPPAIISD